MHVILVEMAITKTDVEYIAALARIKLDNHEKEKYARELGAILGYIDKLKEVDTESVKPVAHVTGLENVARKDIGMKKPLEDQAAKAARLVEMAPERKDNYVKVPPVFGE